MAKNKTKQNKLTEVTSTVQCSNVGSFTSASKKSLVHKLNIPMDKSQMSKSDKATFKAWNYTYTNREKRID